MSHEKQRGDWWKRGKDEPPEYDPEITGGDDPMFVDPYDEANDDSDHWWKHGEPPPSDLDEVDDEDGMEPA